MILRPKHKSSTCLRGNTKHKGKCKSKWTRDLISQTESENEVQGRVQGEATHEAQPQPPSSPVPFLTFSQLQKKRGTGLLTLKTLTVNWWGHRCSPGVPDVPGEAHPKVCQYVSRIRFLGRTFQLKQSRAHASSHLEHFLEPRSVLQVNTQGDRCVGALWALPPWRLQLGEPGVNTQERLTQAPATATLCSSDTCPRQWKD